jgi:DNA-binding IclR family transcriptional regulator
MKRKPAAEAAAAAKAAAASPESRKFVVALARGLEVLRAFRPRDDFLGNSEIAERTGLPKPTVTRLTYTLCQLGYLTLVPRIAKYRLAPQAITLGYSALANLAIRRIARPIMDEAAERLGAPVALGVLDRNRALYVDISRGSATFTIQLDVGSRIPLAKTAMGWALLAGMEERERESVMSRLAEHHGRDWPAYATQIKAALNEHRSKGYVRSMGVWRDDINAVGVALPVQDGSGVYALNCGGPPYKFTAAEIAAVYGPALVETVGRIRAMLDGHDGRSGAGGGV